ncbi:MAG TPA: glycosyl hydrolase family 8, partial [Patescibacteria group bacterium]|nr:glycosyl hydrolase family 8 [Patescibacteria group bacterium]
TDGDEDVAMALVLADKKQQRGEWKKNDAYGKKAQVLIHSIFTYMTGDGYLWPGDYGGNPQELNLSYFSPAWYRVFNEYETTDHDWQRVIDKQYEILLTVAQRFNGLIPDWCNEFGDVTNTNRPHDMTYDAIRVPWRIAIDSLWNNEPRAKEYLDQVLSYVLSKDGVTGIQMYSIPSGDTIQYHNEMSVAMWAAGAFGSSQPDTIKQQFVDEIYTYWNPTDNSFNKQEADSKWRYFNQSLMLLGTSLIDGSFTHPDVEQSANNSNNPPSSDSSSNSNSSSPSPTPENTTSAANTAYEKKGTVLKRKILVRVTQKSSSYTIKIFRLKKGKRTRFFKKTYSLNYPLQRIVIKKKKIILQHASNIQKTFHLSLRLHAK